MGQNARGTDRGYPTILDKKRKSVLGGLMTSKPLNPFVLGALEDHRLLRSSHWITSPAVETSPDRMDSTRSRVRTALKAGSYDAVACWLAIFNRNGTRSPSEPGGKNLSSLVSSLYRNEWSELTSTEVESQR